MWLMHVCQHADQYGGTHQADMSPFARLNPQKSDAIGLAEPLDKIN
jgi:hypothetical protein